MTSLSEMGNMGIKNDVALLQTPQAQMAVANVGHGIQCKHSPAVTLGSVSHRS